MRRKLDLLWVRFSVWHKKERLKRQQTTFEGLTLETSASKLFTVAKYAWTRSRHLSLIFWEKHDCCSESMVQINRFKISFLRRSLVYGFRENRTVFRCCHFQNCCLHFCYSHFRLSMGHVWNESITITALLCVSTNQGSRRPCTILIRSTFINSEKCKCTFNVVKVTKRKGHPPIACS